MNDISIVSTADLHLGKHKHGILNVKTGLDTSLESVLRCLDHLVYYCIKQEVKIVLINGDLSKGKTLSEEERSELYRRIKKLNDNGIIVVILKGNHDGNLNKTSSFNVRSLKILDLKNVYVIDEPRLIILESFYIIAMPYIESVDTWIEQYRSIRKKVLGKKKKIIVALHGNVEGVKGYHSENLESDEPPDIPLSIFKNDEGILAVCCGHQHEHQVLLDKPYVFYSGSLDRVTYAEKDQAKGFVHLRYEDKKLRKKFVEVEAKKFIQIEIIGKKIPKLDYKDAIVRVIVDVKDSSVDLFDIDYIEQKIMDAGAQSVKVKRRILEGVIEKKFNTTQSRGLSFKKRISNWVSNNVPESIREAVKQLGIEIIEEAQEVK